MVSERALLTTIYLAPVTFLSWAAINTWRTGSDRQVDPLPFVKGNLPWTAANVATLIALLYLWRGGI